MCDATNIDCWRECFECLDDIFGDEDVIDEPVPEPEPQGIACAEFCHECTFEDMDCWEECHECLDPHFGDEVDGEEPLKEVKVKANLMNANVIGK